MKRIRAIARVRWFIASSPMYLAMTRVGGLVVDAILPSAAAQYHGWRVADIERRMRKMRAALAEGRDL